MMCLNALWQLGEGNVEEVRRVVAAGKPLAYTTVLTLLDRLARRGAVSRRKEGRGYRYQPTVERSRLRHMALKQFLEYHFDGSVGELKIFLETAPIESEPPESSGLLAMSAANMESVSMGSVSSASMGSVSMEPLNMGSVNMESFDGDGGPPPDYAAVAAESASEPSPDSEM